MNDVAMQRLNNPHSEQKCNSNKMKLGNNKIEFGKHDVLKNIELKEGATFYTSKTQRMKMWNVNITSLNNAMRGLLFMSACQC